MSEEYETEVEFIGEMRPCTVSYTINIDGDIEISRVMVGKLVVRWHSVHGEFEPRDERVDVDVTTLLSADQIVGFDLEIIDALTKETV